MSDNSIGYNITCDSDLIKIRLDTVGGCEYLLSDMESFGIVLEELIKGRRDSLLRMEVNHGKYVEWWNEVIVPKLLDMELSYDDLDWKWGQLVRQEFRMWIRSNKPVGMDEITWISDRRGFDEMQRKVLVEGLQLLGLYSEIPTLYRDSIVDSDACAKKMEVLSQIDESTPVE